MINWVDNIQFRFKLDNELRNLLIENGVNPDTYFIGRHFMWSTESDILFTALSDFRAMIFMTMAQSEETSCQQELLSCIKIPDLFNIMQDSLQHLFNIYTAYIPVILIIYPANKVIQTLNNYPIIFAVLLPAGLFMMQHQIFKKISQHWRSGLLKNRIVIIITIIICMVISISRYMMCFDNHNIWINFVQRLLVVSICIPTSILLEWACF